MCATLWLALASQTDIRTVSNIRIVKKFCSSKSFGLGPEILEKIVPLWNKFSKK